ncbi:MAG TPA: tetratricopeptide repeat protein [Candidatus Limnocylindrales bacterium]|nr:tetratricopeptide repeat protein [Candidatus Limnocylindrales bacterium]
MTDSPTPDPESEEPRPAKPPSGRSGRAASRGGGAESDSLYERYKDALRRGHVAALRGRNDAALDAYSDAASIAPERALPHASIGGVLVKLNRASDAIAAYQRALKLSPTDEPALRGIAEALADLGRRAEAATALDRLAEALDAAGRLADATDAARRALELAESRSRRRHLAALVDRLRAAPEDDAAEAALVLAVAVLEPSVAEETSSGREGDAPVAAGDPAESLDSEKLVAPVDEAVAPEAEPAAEPVVEPAGLGIALGAAAEAQLHAGALDEAHAGLLAAARAHRRAGRLSAALDACDLAIGIAPADPDLHLLLAELYLDHGWRQLATDKLVLLGRIADLDGDAATRDRLRQLVTDRLPDEARLADLVA